MKSNKKKFTKKIHTLKKYNKNHELGMWTSLDLFTLQNAYIPPWANAKGKWKCLLMDRNLWADPSLGWQPLALICWAEVIELHQYHWSLSQKHFNWKHVVTVAKTSSLFLHILSKSLYYSSSVKQMVKYLSLLNYQKIWGYTQHIARCH